MPLAVTAEALAAAAAEAATHAPDSWVGSGGILGGAALAYGLVRQWAHDRQAARLLADVRIERDRLAAAVDAHVEALDLARARAHLLHDELAATRTVLAAIRAGVAPADLLDAVPVEPVNARASAP